MKLRRFGIVDFLACLISHVEEQTGKRLYEAPQDQKAPFFALDLVETEPTNTKTEFIDRFQVSIHAIAAPNTGAFSFQPVLELLQELEEAMTVKLAIPAPFRLIDQDYVGLNTLKQDPSGEGHAVVTYRFDVLYGFMCK